MSGIPPRRLAFGVLVLGGLVSVVLALLFPANSRLPILFHGWDSLAAYNLIHETAQSGDTDAALKLVEAGYRAGSGMFYASVLGARYFYGTWGPPRRQEGLELMREAAAIGEWASRYDYAVALLEIAGIDVFGSDGSRPLNVPQSMLRSSRFLEARRHLISLAAEDYAPALVLLWRIGEADPGSGDLADTLNRAAALGHPRAALAKLRSEVGGASLCAQRDRLLALSENGQIEAIAALAHCAAEAPLEDKGAAMNAMSWLYAARIARAERSYYGWLVYPRTRVAELRATLMEMLSEAELAEAEALGSVWLETSYDPIPPQCQTYCFTRERGFYRGSG